jgi:hypothetical protein
MGSVRVRCKVLVGRETCFPPVPVLQRVCVCVCVCVCFVMGGAKLLLEWAQSSANCPWFRPDAVEPATGCRPELSGSELPQRRHFFPLPRRLLAGLTIPHTVCLCLCLRMVNSMSLHLPTRRVFARCFVSPASFGRNLRIGEFWGGLLCTNFHTAPRHFLHCLRPLFRYFFLISSRGRLL